MICPKCHNEFKYYKLKIYGINNSRRVESFQCPHCGTELSFDDKDLHTVKAYFISIGLVLAFFVLNKFTFLNSLVNDPFWAIIFYASLLALIVKVFLVYVDNRQPLEAARQEKTEVKPLIPSDEPKPEPFDAAQIKEKGPKKLFRVFVSIILISAFIIPSAINLWDRAHVLVDQDAEMGATLLENRAQSIVRTLETTARLQNGLYPLSLSLELMESSMAFFGEDMEKMEKKYLGKVIGIEDFKYSSDGETFSLCLDPSLLDRCWRGGKKTDKTRDILLKEDENYE